MYKVNILVLVLISSILFACNGSSGVSVDDAWVREVPEGIETTALYMNIRNNNERSDMLLSVKSDIAASAEIHKTSVNKDGISYMEKIETIEIPPSSTIKLEPGGMHVMLIGLKKKIKSGDIVEVITEFRDSGTKQVKAKIRGLDD